MKTAAFVSGACFGSGLFGTLFVIVYCSLVDPEPAENALMAISVASLAMYGWCVWTWRDAK